MSELKIKYQDDSEFKCIRRIACKLGLAMPESDDEILNLSQFRRIERAINSEFEQLTSLANENERLRSERDELHKALESTNKELYFVINELNKYKTKDFRCDQLDPPELHDMETCHLNAVLLQKNQPKAILTTISA